MIISSASQVSYWAGRISFTPKQKIKQTKRKGTLLKYSGTLGFSKFIISLIRANKRITILIFCLNFCAIMCFNVIIILEGKINQKVINLLDNIKNNKKLVAIILVIALAIVALVLYFVFKSKQPREAENKIVSTLSEKQATDLKANLVILQGKVEVNLAGEPAWNSAENKQEIKVGSSIRTDENSSAVLSFEGGDLLALDSTSQIKITKMISAEISIDQISGKSYFKIEKKDGKVFSVISSDIKATALGTEFSLSAKINEVVELIVFKSLVQAEYLGRKIQIAEMNKFSFNSKVGQYTKSAISDDDKKLAENYTGLMQKASETLANVEQPMVDTNVVASTASQAKPTATSSNNSSVNSNSGSSATSSSNESPSASTSSSSDNGSSGNTSSSESNNSNNANSTDNQNNRQTSTIPSTIFGQYSATSVDDILSALTLVFDDATGDFTEPGGGAPPNGVYHYSPIDLDNLYLGVRDGRLYVKWTVDGELPTTRTAIDGNTIESLTYNIKISADENPDISNACGGTDVYMQINIAYHSDGQIWYNPWYSAICANTAPYNTDDDWKFQNTGNGQAHTYSSGIGKKSVAYSFALADLGSALNVGSSVKISIYSEAESDTFDHYSFEGNTDQSNQQVWHNWTVSEI